MTKKTLTINLKPNFALMDSNFDGYKLKSNSDQEVSIRSIENDIFIRKENDIACYLYTRMESLHNHLLSDQYDSNTIYVFNTKGNLLMYSFSEDCLHEPFVVWQSALSAESKNNEEMAFTFSPSLCFPSSNLAVSSNGCGQLNIMETGDRNSASTWTSVKSMEIPCGSVISSMLKDCSVENGNHQSELHVLLLSIVTPEQVKKDPLHKIPENFVLNSHVSSLHVIHWLTFDNLKWELIRERRLAGLKALEYLSLNEEAKDVIILSHDNYVFIYDSLVPIETTQKEEKTKRNAYKYIFLQDNDEMKIWVTLGAGVERKDLTIDVKSKDLKIKLKDSVLLEKTFLHAVENCAATWSMNDGKLEVAIPKAEENLTWASLFEGGDEEGHEIFEEARVAEAHRHLAHLTSEEWNPSPSKDGAAFDPGQLEPCDDASEDLLVLVVDGKSHDTSHAAHLGAVQHLFNNRAVGSLAPSFCLRHDVDGVLWRPEGLSRFVHEATFNAFGYVRASKQGAKFTLAAPDNSYVAVCDVNSHVYIFCQPGALGGELRNRNTGCVKSTVARQLVVSLRDHEPVMGFYAAKDVVFVLTNSQLAAYMLDLKQ